MHCGAPSSTLHDRLAAVPHQEPLASSAGRPITAISAGGRDTARKAGVGRERVHKIHRRTLERVQGRCGSGADPAAEPRHVATRSDKTYSAVRRESPEQSYVPWPPIERQFQHSVTNYHSMHSHAFAFSSTATISGRPACSSAANGIAPTPERPLALVAHDEVVGRQSTQQDGTESTWRRRSWFSVAS